MHSPLPSICAFFTLLFQTALWAQPGVSDSTLMPKGSPVTKETGDTIMPPPQVEWKEIAQLPAPEGEERHSGLAGEFAGSHGLHLIIAGGANYGAGQEAAEAPRTYWKEIHVLEKTRSAVGDHKFEWKPAGAELSQELAYGASVNVEDGLLCIGGRNASTCFAECFLLQWSEAEKKVTQKPFPKLPVPLAQMSATIIENKVYVIGGRETVNGKATKNFFVLDLKLREDTAAFAWHRLVPWDGPARIHPLAAAGSDGDSESLYLCGGRNPGGLPGEDFLTDLHRFDPRKKSWSMLGNVLDPEGNTATLMAAPMFFVPPHHMVVVSGIDEKLTQLLEDNGHRSVTKNAAESADRRKLIHLILENFPGYSRNVMAFDIVASEWSVIGAFPERPPVATPVVPWDGNYIIPLGETGPGKRSNKIWQASVKKKARIVE